MLASVMRDLTAARLLRVVLPLFFLVCVVAPSCAPPEFNFVGKDPASELPNHCANQMLDDGETDVDCGDECPPCAMGQSCSKDSDCAQGECIDSFCQDPSCTDGEMSGDESDVDCGGPSCKPCAVGASCRANRDCDSKVCTDDGTCAAPTCDDRVFNGDETDVDCGGSCSPCTPGRRCKENQDCVGEVCGLDRRCAVVCVEGRADCDLNTENGCEVNLKTDPDNCGKCGHECALAHAVPDCSGGECVIASCSDGYLDCNGDPEDGCEINGNTDINNCGACGNVCPALRGSARCVKGECAINCEPGFANCDGDLSNGCEKSVLNDVNNCGACGHVCPAQPGFTPWCVNGECGETQCPDGFGDCNGNPEDGCEVDLRSNADHCNTCGNFCSALNGTAACDERVCIVASCDPGFADCNGKYSDGCEVNTNTSIDHCGACNERCEIENATAECQAGECRVKTCLGTYRDCDGNGTDCEVDIATDPDNCGGCGSAGSDCSEVFAGGHAHGACVNQVCQPGVCYDGYANCDMQAANGCEAQLGSVNHCGGCNIVCKSGSSVHASGGTSCENDTCKPVCDSGWGACGDPKDGCMTRLDTAQNCGSCGNQCTGSTPFCVNQSCAARLPVVLEGSAVSPNAQVCNGSCPSFSLSLSYNMKKGQGNHRLVVVAVASTGQDLNRARPSSLTFAGLSRSTPTASVMAPNRAWAGVYVFKDSELPANAGASTSLSVSFTNADAASRAAAAIYEYSGVEQGTPIVTNVTKALASCNSPTSPVDPVTIATAGSPIVSVATLFANQVTATPTANPATLNKIMDLRANEFAALSGHAMTTSTVQHNVGWNVSGVCNNSAHVVVVLDPAKTP